MTKDAYRRTPILDSKAKHYQVNAANRVAVVVRTSEEASSDKSANLPYPVFRILCSVFNLSFAICYQLFASRSS
jgi:hypothetical protein